MGVQINGDTGNISATKADYSGNVTIGGTLTYEDVTNIDSVGLLTARTGIEIGARPGVAASISVDGNMIVSGVSTFGGESFINDTLNITGNLNIADKIIHTGDTNTSIRFPSSDEVTVETAGTERLSIEPAGNAQFHNYVNVGSGLTVGGLGAGTSLSTVVGQGFLELTRSSGDAYIDFKDAFAGDDFDCRIITTTTNQFQFFTGGQAASAIALQTNTGKVAISTVPIGGAPTIAKLQIHSDKLGGVAGTGYTSGNSQELLYLTSPDISNATSYRFTNYRHTNGTDHTKSEGRLRRHVDVTDQGYIGLGDGYASIGYGSDERFRVSYLGYMTVPQQPYLQVGISGNISVSANTQTEIVFNQENYDTANAYNTSNGRYIVPVTGDYLCTLDLQFTAMVNGFHAGIGINGGNPGTNFDLWNHTGDSVRGDNIARVLRVTANGSNYISFFTYITTAGSLEVNRTKATIKFLG